MKNVESMNDWNIETESCNVINPSAVLYRDNDSNITLQLFVM